MPQYQRLRPTLEKKLTQKQKSDVQEVPTLMRSTRFPYLQTLHIQEVRRTSKVLLIFNQRSLAKLLDLSPSCTDKVRQARPVTKIQTQLKKGRAGN